MLETALDEDLTPGSNRPDVGPDSLWVHLLPDLAPRRLVWLGPPREPVATLLQDAACTTVIDRVGNGADRRPRRACRVSPDAASHVALLGPRDVAILPSDAASKIARRHDIIDALVTALEAGAVVVIDGQGSSAGRRRHRHAVRVMTSALGIEGLAELSTRDAEHIVAAESLSIPVRPTIRLRRTRRFRARARRALTLGARSLSWWTGRSPDTAAHAHPSDITLHRPRAVGGAPVRTPGVVLLRGAGADATAVPEYLVRLAAHGGVDLRGSEWAVAPPRGYRSQKIIFTLTAGCDGTDLIIKKTQDSRFNARLDTERRALEYLAGVRAAHDRAVPRVVFSGTHGGLLIVGETALPGRPFRRVSTAEPSCAVAAAAVSWLTDLASETARRDAGRGPVLGSVETLTGRFLATFSSSPQARQRLTAITEPIRSNPDAVPAVASHGDPGTWNLLVGPDGEVGFLDWENFESAGMPTWDLLLFLRTFASFHAEAAGRRATVDVVVEGLCRPGPLNRFAQRTLATYADRIELDRELLPALALTCWIHQSLKEATRLAPERAVRSRSQQIVARCLAEPLLLSGLTGV